MVRKSTIATPEKTTKKRAASKDEGKPQTTSPMRQNFFLKNFDSIRKSVQIPMQPFFNFRKQEDTEIIFNIASTKHKVVRDVGKNIMQWTLSTNQETEWDIAWVDNYAEFSEFSKLKPWQRINHFPGIDCLSRKDRLSRNLIRLKKRFPEEYNFFPDTFVLPMDYDAFKLQFNKDTPNPTFIIKPQASSQGRGIFLTQTWKNVHNSHRYIAQRYISKPYLLEGLKFDLRIYVLVTSCDPLRIYLYEDGLARFATSPYKDPDVENLPDVCMHLTNYAINKTSSNFVFNSSENCDDVGHKKSLKSLFKILAERGQNVKSVWEEIKKIVIKTFCCVQPFLEKSYKNHNIDKHEQSVSFQVFGLDIMIDEHFKPWLLEVNSSPSLSTDTPLDKSIKERVLGDAFKLINITAENRNNYKRKLKEMEVKGWVQRQDSARERQELEERIQAKKTAEWERLNRGGYQLIFPVEGKSRFQPDYSLFMQEGKATRASSAVNNGEKESKKKSEPEERKTVLHEARRLAGKSTSREFVMTSSEFSKGKMALNVPIPVTGILKNGTNPKKSKVPLKEKKIPAAKTPEKSRQRISFDFSKKEVDFTEVKKQKIKGKGLDLKVSVSEKHAENLRDDFPRNLSEERWASDMQHQGLLSTKRNEQERKQQEAVNNVFSLKIISCSEENNPKRMTNFLTTSPDSPKENFISIIDRLKKVVCNAQKKVIKEINSPKTDSFSRDSVSEVWSRQNESKKRQNSVTINGYGNTSNFETAQNYSPDISKHIGEVKHNLPKRFAQFLSKIEPVRYENSSLNTKMTEESTDSTIRHSKEKKPTIFLEKKSIKVKTAQSPSPKEIAVPKKSFYQQAKPKLENFLMPHLCATASGRVAKNHDQMGGGTRENSISKDNKGWVGMRMTN